MESTETIISEYYSFLREKGFPCIAAKAALQRNQIHCMVATHMACPADDAAILTFLYDFIDTYRISKESYHSAAVIFKAPEAIDQTTFDMLLWQRLKALRSLDLQQYRHDPRVDSDPMSSHYSFSLKSEAFFIIGLHPGSQRRSRRFQYAALVFNPHAEFEKLRMSNRYANMKNAVRKRDVRYSGSVNPMLADFGDASEVYQYSGIEYQSDWICPLRAMEK
jgi:FPC/CPF motif-containing protein YcgG